MAKAQGGEEGGVGSTDTNGAGAMQIWLSPQLLPQGEVFEDEVLSGTDYTENPAEEMSKRHDHGKNLIGTPVIPACRQVIDSASVRCFGDR